MIGLPVVPNQFMQSNSEPTTQPDTLAVRMFDAIDSLEYCVLRDGGRIHAFLQQGGEIDLLVCPRQLAEFEDRVSKLGFLRLPAWGHEPHRFYVGYDAAIGRWLKLDVVTQVAFGAPVAALTTDLAPACLKRRRFRSPCWIPSPEPELLALFLHAMIDKGGFRLEHRQRLEELSFEIGDRPDWPSCAQALLPPGLSATDLLVAIQRGEWEYLLAQRNRAIQHLMQGRAVRVRSRIVTSRLMRKLGTVAGMIVPRTPSIALMAPDGAGKSSIATQLCGSMVVPVDIVYMGLYSNDPKQGHRPKNFITRVGRLWRGYIQSRYSRARGRLVVFDRYSYDALVTHGQPSNRLRSRLRRWLLANACPAPSLTIILDAPGEALFARKGEHSPEFLEGQRQSLLRLLPRLQPAVVIGVKRDFPAVFRDVERAVWNTWSPDAPVRRPK